MTSATLPLPKVQDLVDTRLAQSLSEVSGVGLVSTGCGLRLAVCIQGMPRTLAGQVVNLDYLGGTIGYASLLDTSRCV